ncbi:hypothetical protein [Piscirickettsia litoralis]|uniref:Uncharacterized protein n=1 Tax=Piscirickettsia litoralis TaxID=1891921 RepID=A0ABX3A4Q9_9GAMM|nr:hypothetical protein [Piscirickettsia litoralis]ODN43843.1 hypothetical protein BGC07_14285 [Piscirickettsia litoralis]
MSNNQSYIERQQAKQLAENIGNPCILPDFRRLAEKVDELYQGHLYRVDTLHRICDEIYPVEKNGQDEKGEGEGDTAISPYSVMSLLYLINPRRTISVFIEFLCSDENAETVIMDNARLLGIKAVSKEAVTVMSKKKSSSQQERSERRHEISLG